MPPTTPQDVLNKLVAATDEAKATIRELHEARKALVETERDQRHKIAELIGRSVAEAIDALRDEARAAMRRSVREAIEGLAADWRAKLGIIP